ncbi:MAG: DUF429 domain-containing protein [Gammaproteobacteria bacterium]|nr:DUF429 domain-containing protein [Gammaproteobacteria bacterium]
MLTVVHGIDFSGDAQKWTPGCRRSNVWIATAQLHDKASLKLVGLRPVQDLPGGSPPFERLVELLAGGGYCAAGIDAPFALPARHMPDGGLPTLLQDVAELPTDSRPFAKGAELVAYGEGNASLEELKPLRKTERFWRGRVNVRSTLWNGPRGGAPFTAGSLTLLGRSRRPVWPWCRAAVGLLVEAFPAAQLHHWQLPHKGYDGPDGASERETIIEGISPRIEIADDLRVRCQESADALDSVLCLFAARAAVAGLAPVDDTTTAELEGWIAVHPQ